MSFDEIEEYTQFMYSNNKSVHKNYTETYVVIVEKTTHDDSISAKVYYATVSEKNEDFVRFSVIESQSFNGKSFSNWSNVDETLTYTRKQIDFGIKDADTELFIYESDSNYLNNNNNANQSAGTRRRRRHRRAVTRRRKSRKAYRRRR